jgi:anti-anti-sigma factor
MYQSTTSHVKSRTEAGVLVLTIMDNNLSGEDQCSAIREELLNAVEQGAKNIIIDFQHVEFVSSVAFRPLLSLRRRIHQVAGRMVLCSLRPLVAEVFEATRLLINNRSSPSLFEEQPTVAAAIALFTNSLSSRSTDG